jgi:hypothetical protein
VLPELASLRQISKLEVLVTTTVEAGAPVPAQETNEEPQSSSERYMASLWAEIIGLERVARSHKFLDVGGNSLTLNVVINRIRLERGVRMAPEPFFDPEKSSVTELAKQLDELLTDPSRADQATPGNGFI